MPRRVLLRGLEKRLKLLSTHRKNHLASSLRAIVSNRCAGKFSLDASTRAGLRVGFAMSAKGSVTVCLCKNLPLERKK